MSPLEPGKLVVDDLWERFRIYHNRPRGIKERLFKFERSTYEDFWALKGVNFTLEPGESLAIIGANGSGKSTLLKCLAKILPPDRGSVEVGGKVASLLELGAGFHGDLTGRENVYLNGSILGLSRREIEGSMEAIISFSGIRDFIDTPVRNYSSGMYVRLGFAVAIHVDPDVLMIDEILAVGDASFQTKCFEKMHDFKRRGKTIVVVSHDLDSAARLCDRAILLDHGNVVADEVVRSTVDVYRQRVLESDAAEAEAEGATAATAPSKRWGTGEAEILEVSLLDSNDQHVESVAPGDVGTFRLKARIKEQITDPIFGLILHTGDGHMIYNANTMWRGKPTGTFHPGQEIEVRFTQRMPLLPGRYIFTTALAHMDGTQWYDWWEDCLFFHIRGSTHDQGLVDFRTEITHRVTTGTGSATSF